MVYHSTSAQLSPLLKYLFPMRTSKYFFPLKTKPRAGEMAQRLRALTALLEVLSSILSNHMVAHNHL
uniref:Uncharacterized protein n=1 Tax=Mus musculus TaxID=10090 RepID=Q6R5D6_MOUSE|nr:unknown [Mus musculus]